MERANVIAASVMNVRGSKSRFQVGAGKKADSQFLASLGSDPNS
jgi:hypothetical protein